MGRRNRGVMSEGFKYELAKDLGFKQKVEQEGWGAITTKEAGNMVKRAIQLAEQSLAGSNTAKQPPQGAASATQPSYGLGAAARQQPGAAMPYGAGRAAATPQMGAVGRTTAWQASSQGTRTT